MAQWLSRWLRPDLSFAVSTLCSRAKSWFGLCDQELSNLVVEMEDTSGEVLLFRVYAEDTLSG